MRWECYALWDPIMGWETTLTPLQVVFTGEKRKGMGGEERQHPNGWGEKARSAQLCREVRWRAGAGVERRRDRQEEAREKGGENRKSCRYENQETSQKLLFWGQQCPLFAAVGC